MSDLVDRLRKVDQDSFVETLHGEAADRIEALESENKRLREGWHPIETAPKDGTRILAYVGKSKDTSSVAEVWWEPDYVKDEWGVTIGGWDDDWDLNYAPSHWMPIPVPPSQK